MDYVGIWKAARSGDLAEVERLVGQDPGLLNAGDAWVGWTPLILASRGGHVGVVRWLLDQGAAINMGDHFSCTAVYNASLEGHPPVVRLLLERGADPTTATDSRWTPLMAASRNGRLEVLTVRISSQPQLDDSTSTSTLTGRAPAARPPPSQRQGRHQPP
jgi:ankyrin repeat protein